MRRVLHTRLPPKPARGEKRTRCCGRRHPALVHRDPFMGPPRRRQAETGEEEEEGAEEDVITGYDYDDPLPKEVIVSLPENMRIISQYSYNKISWYSGEDSPIDSESDLSERFKKQYCFMFFRTLQAVKGRFNLINKVSLPLANGIEQCDTCCGLGEQVDD
ncbi:hypothetical protein KIL84_004628 [Mauremys mutica]|uniref:Uncharacterized protein n=1 Tax=Mauremys mutica TaxID=74926 RepID=A0A9D4B740_9SAUR|nr:hypothetical protein KIL84_004628 [Mauremys mutica]